MKTGTRTRPRLGADGFAALLNATPPPTPRNYPEKPDSSWWPQAWHERSTITIRELADALGVPYPTAWRHATAHPEATLRLGSRILVRLDRLDTIFEETA